MILPGISQGTWREKWKRACEGGLVCVAGIRFAFRWRIPSNIIDAVRCAKLALDRGMGGALLGPSSYFMKTPPEQYPDVVCREKVEEFIAGD